MLPTVALAALAAAFGVAGTVMAGSFVWALVNGNLPEFLSQVIAGFFAPEAVEARQSTYKTLEQVFSMFSSLFN